MRVLHLGIRAWSIVEKEEGVEERGIGLCWCWGPQLSQLSKLGGQSLPETQLACRLETGRPVWLRKQDPKNSHLHERIRGKNTLKVKVWGSKRRIRTKIYIHVSVRFYVAITLDNAIAVAQFSCFSKAYKKLCVKQKLRTTVSQHFPMLKFLDGQALNLKKTLP